MSNHFKVRVSNPMIDGGLGTREEVIQNSDFMAEQHKTVNEMRAYEAGASGNQDAFSLRRRE
jgi:hypothetical protein